jgi:hypothetical protein
MTGEDLYNMYRRAAFGSGAAQVKFWYELPERERQIWETVTNRLEGDALRNQLKLVRDNLRRGMGRSLQRAQATAIDEVLNGDFT